MKDRTETYFKLFLKLNDHFGLLQIYPNGCKVKLKLKKNLKQNLLRVKINTMKGLFSHLNFRPLRSLPIYEQVNIETYLLLVKN